MKKVILTILFAFSFIVPTYALASEVIFVPKQVNVHRGDEFKVDVLLAAENENVNSVEASIPLDPALTLKEIRDGTSIISIWIEHPHLVSKSIIFSGIIPGGYSGKPVLLFSLVMTANEIASGKISATGVSAFHNDENASPSNVAVGSIEYKITKSMGSPNIIPSETDRIQPESFVPEIVKNQSLDGTWVAVFSTLDKQSGLDHYEVAENYFGSPEGSVWKTAESPYILEDQWRFHSVFIKALDRSGNARIVKISSTRLIDSIYILCAILIVLGFVVVRRVRRKFNGTRSF
ncbi:hypothetical protein KW783_00340 [Candidatus Parcubacteria bacterium]|nr:hypothetical protein [Candidatus Parcubacteria bacterium]